MFTDNVGMFYVSTCLHLRIQIAHNSFKTENYEYFIMSQHIRYLGRAFISKVSEPNIDIA